MLAGAGLLAVAVPLVPSYDPWAWLVWGREVVETAYWEVQASCSLG